jgi:cytochrome c
MRKQAKYPQYNATLQEIGVADVFDVLDRIDGMNAVQQITVLQQALAKKVAAVFEYHQQVEAAAVVAQQVVKAVLFEMEVVERNRRRKAGANGG